MQKKLIALAVASLVSGGAFAQSSVTVFGIVDLAVQSGKFSDAAGNLTRMVNNPNATSRLGFKGTEDLGNGLSANFLLEHQVSPDNGSIGVATQFWNRSSTVGLSSKSWGSVNLGRQYTPWFSSYIPVDVFGAVGVGNTYNLVNYGITRMNNSIRWDSVNMSGFSAALSYSFGSNGDATGIEGTTSATKSLGRMISLKLSYANGPMAFNYGYAKQKTAIGVAAVAAVAAVPFAVNPATGLTGNLATPAVAATSDVDTTGNQLNGSYDFKVAKVVVAWNTAKNSDNSMDNRVWLVGGKIPVFGKDTIKLAYARLNNKLAADSDARLISIGYEHPLSKRTNLYGTWAKMNNDTLAARTLTGGVAVAAGYDPSAFEVGLSHKF